MKNFSEVKWNWERQPEEGEHAITCNVGFKNPETGLSDETSFDMKIETAEEELKDLFDEFCEENDSLRTSKSSISMWSILRPLLTSWRDEYG